MSVTSDREIRSTITDDEIGGFRITIPARRNWSLVAFLSLWLCGWAVGELVALSWFVIAPLALIVWATGLVAIPIRDMLAQAGIGDARLGAANAAGTAVFFLVWFAFWTYAGSLMIYAWLWNLAGREVIVFADDAMVVRAEVPRWGRSRTFPVVEIRNLRYAPPVLDLFTFSWRKGRESLLIQLGVDPGSIAFDHDGKTERFGRNLPEIEARRLIATITQRFKIPGSTVPEPLPIAP